MVKINGEKTDADGKTVEEYLSGTTYNAARIALELNGQILPKSRYAQTVLKDGDLLEIVNFVGGG